MAKAPGQRMKILYHHGLKFRSFKDPRAIAAGRRGWNVMGKIGRRFEMFGYIGWEGDDFGYLFDPVSTILFSPTALRAIGEFCQSANPSGVTPLAIAMRDVR